MMLWLAVLFIACAWLLRREAKKLAAAQRVPTCAPTKTNRDEEPK